MINVETVEGTVLKVQPIGKLEDGDFEKIGANVDQLIKSHGHIKLLIDATEFTGWADAEAAKKHFAFIRDHQKKVDQIAVIAGHEWQHWVAAIASVFVHPEIKLFDKDGIIQAESWLTQKRAA